MTPSTTHDSRISPWLLFPLFLLLTGSLVNFDGADWDGVQIVLGSLFPTEAARGYTVLYRPEWQPLTYGILRFVYALTHSVQACMFLPALFGATGLTLLFSAMQRVGAGRVHPLLLVGTLLLVPELLFGAIYMNSMVFGFPFAAGAMRLVVADWTGAGGSRRRYAPNLLAGALLAGAALCRFEFLLAGPMFLFLLVRTRPAHLGGKLAALLAGGAAVLAAAYGTGLLDWRAVLAIVREHQAGTGQQGAHYYFARVRVLLALLGINLFAWAAAGAGALHWLYVRLRDRRWLDLLVFVPLAALLYPAPSLTTPKYLVPFYLFVTVFLAWMLAQPLLTGRWAASALPVALTAVVLLACFLPIHPSRADGGSVRLTTETWRGTDDGPRSFWGYAFALREVSSLREPPALPPAGRWLDTLTETASELVLLAPYDGWVANASVSQPYLFHLVRGFRQVELGPGYVWAVGPDKKVLLAEPGTLSENLPRCFCQTPKPPAPVAIPLNIPAEEMALLRQMAQGATSEAELTRRNNGDRELVVTTLKALVRRSMIEPVGPGEYRPRYHLRERESAS